MSRFEIEHGPAGPRFHAERADRFYTRLRARLTEWLGQNAGVSPRVSQTLLLVPDFFALIVRLIQDPRVDAKMRAQLLLVSAYVMSPLDLIPDFLLPPGLLDDVVAMAFVLSRLARIMTDSGEHILREHWEGPGDILAQIQKVAATADRVLDEVIVQRLRRSGGGKG
ncbi:MAG: DUF1232 domain-containing protein [Chloroflexi bacterium]|nr:DUF1232 domain-containing protein [Chloroflexota bacterium]